MAEIEFSTIEATVILLPWHSPPLLNPSILRTVLSCFLSCYFSSSDLHHNGHHILKKTNPLEVQSYNVVES
ncbi:hypothetical protein HanRHA438_Chr15g0687511 [Helianthus annuus]|nr:hypothetical protein HanPSC8_Chr15g0647821 [Helianthus annuus]KAJ0843086.1 hypothetical protein HanRHA438_Chr15g0687511 [Helianthus annuus]